MKVYDYNGKPNLAGKQIKKLRKQMKLSQDQLAAQLQVAGVMIDQRALSRIECQKRFIADFELREFARILHVSMEELVQ